VRPPREVATIAAVSGGGAVGVTRTTPMLPRAAAPAITNGSMRDRSTNSRSPLSERARDALSKANRAPATVRATAPPRACQKMAKNSRASSSSHRTVRTMQPSMSCSSRSPGIVSAPTTRIAAIGNQGRPIAASERSQRARREASFEAAGGSARRTRNRSERCRYTRERSSATQRGKSQLVAGWSSEPRRPQRIRAVTLLHPRRGMGQSLEARPWVQLTRRSDRPPRCCGCR